MNQKAIFAAGCFWGVEEHFRKVAGVLSTRVGYTGGSFPNPTYEEVCSGNTGHAEAIEITFDSSLISYRELLEHFWSIHDPMTLNRQGPDVGSQYRSAIFFHNEEQRKVAIDSRPENAVTEIVAAAAFFPAEEYHQKYIQKKST